MIAATLIWAVIDRFFIVMAFGVFFCCRRCRRWREGMVIIIRWRLSFLHHSAFFPGSGGRPHLILFVSCLSVVRNRFRKTFCTKGLTPIVAQPKTQQQTFPKQHLVSFQDTLQIPYLRLQPDRQYSTSWGSLALFLHQPKKTTSAAVLAAQNWDWLSKCHKSWCMCTCQTDPTTNTITTLQMSSELVLLIVDDGLPGVFRNSSVLLMNWSTLYRHLHNHNS